METDESRCADRWQKGGAKAGTSGEDIGGRCPIFSREGILMAFPVLSFLALGLLVRARYSPPVPINDEVEGELA